MTKLLKHRCNNASDLVMLQNYNGFEIDIRTHKGKLICQHEPFLDGTDLNEILENSSSNLIVLNVKEDGLEDHIVELLVKYGINKYFFLDQPMPSLIKSLKKGYSCAMRSSDFESISLIEKIKPNWLWIDSFSGNWEHYISSIELSQKFHVSTCLVSPELQSRNSDEEYFLLKEKFGTLFYPDAVCTKDNLLWST